ncbi:photosynthetic complex assembly protein PuhC [Methylorubrum sp. POS3]|uniref:photosynthetic complex assembly protein PuhC n=1 Tax=Methylorubrum sp. POS3 TaxID=2998492 RepID=UPI003729B283
MPIELPARRPSEPPPVRRPLQSLALLGVSALLGIVLLAVFIGRREGVGLTELPSARPVASLGFRAEDRPDGAVELVGAQDNRLVARIAPGEGGFVRGTLRGLAQARQREGLGPEQPFTLTRFDNGTLALEDAATGRHVALEAFGATNAAAFARLLPGNEVQEGRGRP